MHLYADYRHGGALRWFRDRFYDELMSYEAICCSIPEEPTGLLFLPFLSGAGTPEMNTAARGAVWGLTLETDRACVAKSILEGVCYELSWQLDLIYRISGFRPQELTCVGGAANSAVWMQLKADIIGLPVRCLKGWEPGTARSGHLGRHGLAAILGHGRRLSLHLRLGKNDVAISGRETDDAIRRVAGSVQGISRSIILLLRHSGFLSVLGFDAKRALNGNLCAQTKLAVLPFFPLL